MTFPSHLKSIFWDVDSRGLNARKHGSFIISRVVEKGNCADVAWLKRKYPLAKIKSVVRGSHNVSAKTKNFWLNVL